MADTSTILKNAFLIAGAVVGFIALKKIAETFGIIQTKEENAVETATEESAGTSTEAVSTNPFLAFNPLYSNALVTAYNKKYPSKVWDIAKQEKIERTQYKAYSRDLLNAKGIINDDEDKIYSIFKNIQTQYQLSVLARVFNFYWKKDLLEYLKGVLNADELAPILAQVKNYPQYFK
jgi:hypothetical protein